LATSASQHAHPRQPRQPLDRYRSFNAAATREVRPRGGRGASARASYGRVPFARQSSNESL
jgi:hypothetical protein